MNIKEVSAVKKRFISLILIICISALLFSVPSGAASEIFVAAGNTVLPLTDAMPIRSSGVWYIDYQCFTKGGLNVNSSYNAAERTLVLYTWDTTLVFDLNSATAYTTAEKVPYKAVAFVSSGTVYVPAQFTAQMLGFECSYLSDPVMIRIKRSTDIPNNMFQYIAQSEIPNLLAAYNASKKNNNDVSSSAGSQPTSPDDESENNTVRKGIRLTFNITDGANMSKILDSLSRYGCHATFFIKGSAIDNCENELRRAVSGGHSLGMLSQNGSSDFSAGGDVLKNALSSCNDRLFKTAKTKTRLIRIPDGSKTVSKETVDTLISLGYRIWDDSFTPTGSSANRIYNSTVSQLSGGKYRTPTITLTDSDASVSALTRILRYLDANNYRTYTISVLDTPVNDISERR